tara:strand:+ start:15622 stop:15822 length:201 start_codon:yes stop_codon:yes gene_type:complete
MAKKDEKVIGGMKGIQGIPTFGPGHRNTGGEALGSHRGHGYQRARQTGGIGGGGGRGGAGGGGKRP